MRVIESLTSVSSVGKLLRVLLSRQCNFVFSTPSMVIKVSFRGRTEGDYNRGLDDELIHYLILPDCLDYERGAEYIMPDCGRD